MNKVGRPSRWVDPIFKHALKPLVYERLEGIKEQLISLDPKDGSFAVLQDERKFIEEIIRICQGRGHF